MSRKQRLDKAFQSILGILHYWVCFCGVKKNYISKTELWKTWKKIPKSSVLRFYLGPGARKRESGKCCECFDEQNYYANVFRRVLKETQVGKVFSSYLRIKSDKERKKKKVVCEVVEIRNHHHANGEIFYHSPPSLDTPYKCLTAVREQYIQSQ